MISAAALGATALAAEPAGLATIDTHIHVWDLEALNPPWLAGARPILRQRYMAAEYAEATAGLNLTSAIYVEIAERPQRQLAEAQFVLALIDERRMPLSAAVIGGDPAADGFSDYIRRFAKEARVKGLRQALRKGAAADEKFIAGVSLLGELGLSFDLVLGGAGLDDAVRLVDACPGTTFILDHCAYGNPDWFDAGADDPAVARRAAWERGIAALAGRRNIACKISGVAEQTRLPVDAGRLAPVVEHCLAHFGEDRVLFGSNWPVCLISITLADWHAAVDQITASRPAAFRRKLFHDNAVKWYRL
jgi:L-fuconolactonase